MQVSPALATRRSTGFTLIELLVVLVLIGIIFSFAMLSLGGDDLAELMEQETRRLGTLLDLASDEAVLRGEEMAVHFTDTGYEFLILSGNQWQSPQGDRLLQARSLPADIEIRLEVNGDSPGLTDQDDDDEETLTPQVYILSSGEMTAFSATLQSPQSTTRYHLTASLLGEVTWETETTW
ncbi:MAG TPA: type II secretion system minor pseudopilin GspH [Gammaproteobacteria bacterium]|nr:type II secretion system minor pseudopilin GspH [Gammaproteobacteria bacterium]